MKKLSLLLLFVLLLSACTGETTSTEVSEESVEPVVVSVEEQKDIVIKYDNDSTKLVKQMENAADKMQVYMNENVQGILNTVELEKKQEEFIDLLGDLSYEAEYSLETDGLDAETEAMLDEASGAFAEYFYSKGEATKIVFKMEEGDFDKYNKNAELALIFAIGKVGEVKEKLDIPIE